MLWHNPCAAFVVSTPRRGSTIGAAPAIAQHQVYVMWFISAANSLTVGARNSSAVGTKTAAAGAGVSATATPPAAAVSVALTPAPAGALPQQAPYQLACCCQQLLPAATSSSSLSLFCQSLLLLLLLLLANDLLVLFLVLRLMLVPTLVQMQHCSACAAAAL